MLETKKILIVDDEAVIAEHLKMILEKNEINQIELAYSKEHALNVLANYQPDLVLLDIHMKNELDGIELAEIINSDYKIPFIFITAQSDSLIIKKATETDPAAYITKPFKNADIFAALNIAINKRKKVENTFTFKDGYYDIFIQLNTILFVKSEKNYIDIVCRDKKYTLRNSLDWFIQNVQNSDFIRIHRSFVINVNQVKKMSSTQVEISSISIPISRKFIAELRLKLKNKS